MQVTSAGLKKATKEIQVVMIYAWQRQTYRNR